MADTKIKWKIQVDGIDNASNMFKNLEDATGKSNLKLISALQIYQAASLAISQISSVLKDVSREYLKSDEAAVRLNNTLKATGNFSNETSNNLSNYAQKLQGVLGVQDELIKDTISFNLALGLNAQQAEAATTASASLAKALGMDLNTANQQLASTLSGNTGRLARFIPELKNLTQRQLEAGEAINIVNQRFNSFLVNTNSVSELAKQIELSFGDIKESIGKGFLGGKDQIESMQKVVAMLRSLESTGTAEKIGVVFRDITNVTVSFVKTSLGALEIMFESIFGRFERIIYSLMEGFYRVRSILPSAIGGNGKKDEYLAETYKQAGLKSQLNYQQLQNDVFGKTNETGSSIKKLFNDSVELKKASENVTVEYDKQLEILKKQDVIKAKNIQIEKDFNPEDVTKAINAANGGLNSVAQYIGSIFGSQGTMVASIITFFNRSKEEMKKFVDDFANNLQELPARIVENLPIVMQKMLEIQLSPSFWFRVVANLGNALKNVFNDFFKNLFFGSNGSSLTTVIEKAGQLFNPTQNAGKEIFQIKDYAEGQVAQTFEDRVTTVTTAASKGLIQELIDGLSGIGAAIWNGLKDALSSAWDWFKSIGQRIWEGLKEGLDSLNPFGGGGLFGGLTGALTGALSGVFSLGSGGGGDSLWGGVSSTVSSIGGSFGFAEGGLVPGNAPFQGNSYGNDIVPAFLSPGEYVVSRDEMRTGNFSGLYAAAGTSGSSSMNVSVNINVGAGSQLTEAQLRSNVVPVIVGELRKLSQNGTQIVSKKGVF